MVQKDCNIPLWRLRCDPIHRSNPCIRCLEAARPTAIHRKPGIGDCAGTGMGNPGRILVLAR